MSASPPLTVKVWGEFACFTRPEMKVERVTYPMMTPSAARGVLESIFWKPEFQWRIREIWLLKPIRYFSIVRNEINSLQSDRAAAGWIKSDGGYYADEDRAQRHTLALRDVAYIIKADVCPKANDTGLEAKYRDQFRRRVQRGQCYHMPYLGCREFSGEFGEPGPEDRPIDCSDDLGQMLWDMDYDPEDQGKGTPIFFHAALDKGVLRVPLDLHRRYVENDPQQAG